MTEWEFCCKRNRNTFRYVA